jgi:hypothetical protein
MDEEPVKNKPTEFDPIEKLKTDQTVVFYTPLEDETSVYVRTGITKTNSFLHSVLSAKFSDYLFMKKPHRKILAEKIMNELLKLNKEDWVLKESNEFKRFCAIYMLGIKSKIDENPIDSPQLNQVVLDNLIISKEVCKLFFTIVDINNLFKTINNLTLTNEEFKGKFKTMITSAFDVCNELKLIKPDKADYILKQLNNFIDIFLETIEKLVYSEFLNSNQLETINFDTEPSIADHFKYNIFVLDSVTRLPLLSEYKMIEDYDSSIVLVKFQDKNTYEIVGEMLPGYITVRIFENDCNFIKKIIKEIKNQS